jgi:AmmeMemoRadiSam system protein B
MEPALDKPRLRPVEVRPSGQGGEFYEVHDPSGLAPQAFRVSSAALSVMSKLDGRHDRAAIQVAYLRRHGRLLFSNELDVLIGQLDAALFLEGPRFGAHCDELLRQYRAMPARPLRDPRSLGAPIDQLAPYLSTLLNGTHRHQSAPSGRPVRGLIAPHLDYARGAPCYSAAYRDFARRCEATRFVVLGTNHFGRARGVVGTRKDFDTPLGVVRHDADFMRLMDERLGLDLCDMELDHAREHSVELQAVLLRYLFADRDIRMAAYLCPDPCGDGAAGDNRQALGSFAAALREELAADATPTCIIAGADLSHVGRFFQDDRELNADELHAVETLDRGSLAFLEHGDAEGFRSDVAARGNSTNICSVGCMYALAAAMDGSSMPRLLHYHQALTREIENCVTCCAMEWN